LRHWLRRRSQRDGGGSCGLEAEEENSADAHAGCCFGVGCVSQVCLVAADRESAGRD
jgi:hypothetical protein